MPANNDELLSKLEGLTASVQLHSEKSGEFQAEVMDILKGSFEGGKWVPGMAPLLKEQAGRIDTLEAAAKTMDAQRVTWRHGVGFSLLGALLAQISATFHPFK